MNPNEHTPITDDEFIRLQRIGEEASRALAERDLERSIAVRELILALRVSRFEAGAWADAWLDAGKPVPVEPWVSSARDRDLYYSFETASLTDTPETSEQRARRADQSARAGEAERCAKSIHRDLRRHTSMEQAEIALWVDRAIAAGVSGNVEGWVAREKERGVTFDPGQQALVESPRGESDERL